MRVAIDPHDTTTAYADLREDQRLTDETRAHAIKRGRQLGAENVEFWRPPYGEGVDRMDGFVELARIPPESESESGTTDDGADEDLTEASTQQLSREADARAGRSRSRVSR